MTYSDLGFDSFGARRVTTLTIQAPQEVRNSFKFGSLNASSAYIGENDTVFKADKDGIYLGNDKFADAPFSVDMDGNLIATQATVSGAISSSTIDIGGADATSFHVDVDGNVWAGAAAFADGAFKVSNAGAVDVGGSDASSFHVDATGNIWSGAAAYADGPFKVSNAGALTAQSVTIKDSNGTSVVDSSGLVSSTQFSSGSQIGTGSQSTNATSWTDVTGLSESFTLVRTQNVYLFAQIIAYNDDYLNSYSEARMIVDSTVVGVQASSITSVGLIFGHMQDVVTLAAGSHTIKLQVKSVAAPDTGNTVVTLDQSIVGYLTLGK